MKKLHNFYLTNTRGPSPCVEVYEDKDRGGESLAERILVQISLPAAGGSILIERSTLLEICNQTQDAAKS